MKKLLLLLVLIAGFKISLAQPTCQDVSVELTAVVQKSPARITLNWVANTNTVYATSAITVSRKYKGATNFNSLIATLNPTVTSFIDSNVVAGVYYEYAVQRLWNGSPFAYGYIASGIEVPETVNRGKIILLVDSSFSSSLNPELKRLADDFEGDGWDVIRKDVSRNGSVGHVKSVILTVYNSDPGNVKALFIFGHVPVPYSGTQAWDGHTDHMGAWSTDTYYADMNGVWTDAVANVTVSLPPRTQNIPGDGKFDHSNIPSDLELQTGRVDLWGLTSFTATEQQLLKNYLDKDHNYRFKNIAVIKQAVIDDNFGYYGSGAFAASGWKNFSPLVGTANVTANDYFTVMSGASYQWSYGCGGGTYVGAGGVGNTTNFSTSNLNGIFTMLFGSYFGDWDIQDNFLRAALAQGNMLTNCWSGYPHWQFHQMAMGDPIGYCTRLNQNNSTLYLPGYPPRGTQMNLMGDPTLRNDVVAPVTNVIATRVGKNCNILWSASTQTNILGYNVYMKNDSNTTYTKVNKNIVSGTAYVDSCMLYKGVYKYMVRAIALENTPSGTYFNLSQGIADTAYNTNYLKINLSAGGMCNSATGVATFTAAGTNILNFNWTFGDGGTSTQASPIHTYTSNGTYTAMVTADNGCDSKSKYIISMKVDVGIQEFGVGSSEFGVYPNPSNGKINVDLSSELYTLVIYNGEGKAVYREENCSGKKEIDLHNEAKGLYLLQVTGKNNQMTIKKFIIE